MTAREPERTATAGEKAGHASDPAPAHAFTRPGQVAGRPAPDKCMTCGQPEAAHWLPTGAELAETKAAVDERRRASIRALTPDQCQRVLRFLAGYEPRGFDYALEALAEWERTEGGEHA